MALKKNPTGFGSTDVVLFAQLADGSKAPVVLVDNGDGTYSLQIASSDNAAHGDTVESGGFQIMAEAKDFDGAALPNAVDEGDAVRLAASLHGVQYIMPVSEDGSQSPYDNTNNALRVESISRYEPQSTSGQDKLSATELTDLAGTYTASQSKSTATRIDTDDQAIVGIVIGIVATFGTVAATAGLQVELLASMDGTTSSTQAYASGQLAAVASSTERNDMVVYASVPQGIKGVDVKVTNLDSTNSVTNVTVKYVLVYGTAL